MDKYALAHDVLRLLEGELDAIGFELLDVRVFRGGGRLQLRIYVDTAYGIDLDGCARASRTVGMLLEESDLIPGPYVIEVSSPVLFRAINRWGRCGRPPGSDRSGCARVYARGR